MSLPFFVFRSGTLAGGSSSGGGLGSGVTTLTKAPFPKPEYSWIKDTGRPELITWQWAQWVDTALLNQTLLVDANAWTDYTPTASSGTGALGGYTSTGRYKQIGKTVFVEAEVTILVNGTGATSILISLPLPSKNSAVLVGQNSAFNSLVGKIAASASVAVCRLYNGTYPGGVVTITLSGEYETT